PVLGVQLVLVLFPGEQLHTHVLVKARAEQGIGTEAVLDRQVVVHEVWRPAGLREIVKRTAVKLDGRIYSRRLVCLYQVGECVEAIPQPVGDAGGEEVARRAEAARKTLDAVIGVAVFARRLVVNRPASTDHGPGRQLVSQAQPGAEGGLAGFAHAPLPAPARTLARKPHPTPHTPA